MTARQADFLLTAGRVTSLILQGLCAFAAAIFILLILFVLLISQDMLGGFAPAEDFALMQQAPLPYVGIGILMTAMLTALFVFFGKMRKIIASVGDGDPFIAENANRLNSMAWLLLAVEILALLVGFLRLHLANLNSGGGERLDFSVYDLTGFILILVLFILARVFRHGTAMRADLEGTV